MAPSNVKANYKSYEAQARMVRAIVAAHPDVKWNYKEIATCYGSDMTEHALNHRFRRLRAQAVIIREGRAQGFDMRNLLVEDNMPTAQDAVDRNNIAKYFGQSTADGIQFQFRGIKKDADRLREVHSAGGDVAGCLSIQQGVSSVGNTPTKAARTPTGRKRGRAPRRSSSTEPSDNEPDLSDEETPSKRPSKHPVAPPPARRTGTPRRAAERASATIATSAQTDGSDVEIVVKEEYMSIFGDPAAAAASSGPRCAFTQHSTDPVISSTMGTSLYSDFLFDNPGDEYYEGEI